MDFTKLSRSSQGYNFLLDFGFYLSGFFIAGALIFGLFQIYKWIKQMRENLKDIPGPPALWTFDTGIFRYDKFFNQHCKRYGALFKDHWFGVPYLVVADATVALHILQKNPKNFVKGKMYWDLLPLIGNGLVTSEGDLWEKHRKIINPHFKVTSLPNYFEDMLTKSKLLLQKLEGYATSNKEFNLSALYSQFSLDIIGKLSFDYEFNSMSVDESFLTRLVESTLKTSMDYHFMNPFLKAFPTKIWKAYKTDIEKLHSEISKIIENHKQKKNTSQGTFLSQLLNSGLTQPEIRDEICTFLIAGHETTANLLSWTSFLLAQHPEIESKLRDEIDTVCLHSSDPTIDALSKLKYLDAILKESMRMFPPIPAISRDVVADDIIELADHSELRITSGMTVFISLTALHKNPENFPSPEEFRPDRFFESSHPPLILPFADGPRSCIGRRLALLEAKLILCLIYHKFSFKLTVLPEEIDTYPTVSLRPKDGLPMKCLRRE